MSQNLKSDKKNCIPPVASNTDIILMALHHTAEEKIHDINTYSCVVHFRIMWWLQLPPWKGRYCTNDIFNCSMSKKRFVFWFKFHWCLFPVLQLEITQHWVRLWPGADQAPSHYLNQWRQSQQTPICVTNALWVISQTLHIKHTPQDSHITKANAQSDLKILTTLH